MSHHHSSVSEIGAYAVKMLSKSRPPENVLRGAWQLSIIFGVYAALVVGLSGLGIYGQIHANFFATTVALATIGLSLAYFRIRSIRALAEWLGPHGLAYFHIWRIGAALAFLYYGAQGWLPQIFVTLAGWGDMLAGVLAALILVIPRGRRSIAGFHIIGFADFLVAVGTGVLLTQIAAQSMTNLTALPIALIPLVGVPLSGATHIAALHMLWKARAD